MKNILAANVVYLNLCTSHVCIIYKINETGTSIFNGTFLATFQLKFVYVNIFMCNVTSFKFSDKKNH